jgi:hypothetical protein
LTLHDPDGNRIMGFDNAHAVDAPDSGFRKPGVAYDHWHRTDDDEGRPYRFTTADQLLADFFAELRRELTNRGVSDAVISDSDHTKRRPQ